MSEHVLKAASAANTITLKNNEDGTFSVKLGESSPTEIFKIDANGILLPEYRSGSFKNKIIGGDFATNPWQRGTSFTAPASNTYTADRWTHGYVTSAVFNILKTADAPTAAEAGVYTTHCFHLDVTTADASIAASDICNVFQRIEGYNAAALGFGQSGTRYVTLSFCHKHTKTGTYCVALTNSAADRAYVAEYSQAVSDQWEKATVTIPVDTSGTWLYDSGVGVNVRFVVAAGSNFHTTAGAWQSGSAFATANQVNALDSTSNNFKIALVQLEAGSVATPFDVLSKQQVQYLCDDYFQLLNGPGGNGTISSGFAYSTTLAITSLGLRKRMRATPTIGYLGALSDYRLFRAVAQITPTAIAGYAAYSSARLDISVASGLTAGEGVTFELYTSAAGITASAEL